MSHHTIFVALASYCEPEIDLTIQDCLDKAKHPENLRFGVCLQYDNDGPDIIKENCIDHRLGDERFRIRKFDYRKGRGGCWARHHVQAMYADETYTLQVDAHTRFFQNWDDVLIQMLHGLPSEKPLITSFPPLYFREDDQDIYTRVDEPDRVDTMTVKQWTADGWLHHVTVDIPENTARPRRTRLLCGALVFTLGQWNREVMQDPENYYTGEEFALTLRSFTSGYDLFDPDRNVVWHRCHPEPNRKHFTDFDDWISHSFNSRALERLRMLLKNDPEGVLGPYGLGTERTLEEFHVYSGLNCETYEVHPDAAAGVPPDPITVRPCVSANQNSLVT